MDLAGGIRNRFIEIVNVIIVVFFLLLVAGVFGSENVISKYIITPVENYIYDARLIINSRDDPDNRIVIIDIDEKSLAAEGRWPWSRNKVARMLDNLFDYYKVEIVGFDVLFAEPDESSGLKILQQIAADTLSDVPEVRQRIENMEASLDYDQLMANSIRDRKVILGLSFQEKGSVTNPGVLPEPILNINDLGDKQIYSPRAIGYSANLETLQSVAIGAGHFNPSIDQDGIIRRVPMLYEYAGNYYESLSLSVVRNFLGVEVEPVFAGEELQLGESSYLELESLKIANLVIPVDEETRALVPYRGKQGSFNYISATDVINRTADRDTLQSAIVLVGTTAPGLFDLRSTPVESPYPGVEIHANLVAGILDENIKESPAYVRGAEFITLFIIGLLLIFALPRLTPTYSALTIAILLGIIIVTNYQVWLRLNLALPLATMLIMILLLFILNMTYGFVVERRNRSNLSNLFGQYVPSELVLEMNKDPESYSLEPDEREMTVLFSDVRGFTTLSEGLDPKQLGTLMNEFLTPLTHIIHDHRGTIDKYMGDAIMAFWGAPVKDDNHAQHALQAGLAMIEKMHALSHEFISRGFPELKIGVGINTGLMNVGNMGSEFRMAYTILGDAVNLGSRLEGLTKQYGVDLIAGEKTVEASPDYVFRKLDQVRVKGKFEPVSIYEPLGRVEEMSMDELNELKTYNTALDEYLGQKWQVATMRFTNLMRMYSERTIYKLYIERINYFRENPPGDEWDGVFVHTSK